MMNQDNKLSFLDYTPQTLPPAQLFIGPSEQTVQMVKQLLQKILCQHNSCNICRICMQIREKQHHAIMWLHPQKSYTLDDLDDLFDKLAFQLQSNELFFFIIQKADFLTTVCANKLLKPMEEPPTGYHFILLAEHPEQILPTIKSRCIVHTLNNIQIPTISHPLFEIFTKKLVASNEFAKILDATQINERESIELLDQIINYWLEMYQKSHDPNFLPLIQKLQKAQLQPPMPGSSTTFWRNMYLQTYENLQKFFE